MMCEEYLQDFYNHKLLIDASYATKEELTKLSEATKKRWSSGHLLPSIDLSNRAIYLHCYAYNEGVNSIRMSIFPTETGGERSNPMPYVSIREFLEGEITPIKVNEEDIENLFENS